MNTTERYTYFCVSCGEEIKPEQVPEKTMVALSYAALDGAPDTTKESFPVYILRKDLEKLIERKDDQGRQYLTLLEYLQFAYNKRNRHDLQETRAKDAETALEIFHENIASLNAEKDADDYDEDEEEEVEINLPGFNETASAQILKNFPNDICYIDWRLNETNGYFYCLTEKAKARKGITPYWVCENCREEILSTAFQYRHILIGLLGFKSAGKTCLIASLCHTLLDHGGILTATKKSQKEYQNLLEDFKGGYTLAKTDELGHNTYHPSVQKDNILWTFVDIPGEVFFKEGQLGMDMNALTSDPKLQMSLKCHAYILTADWEITEDPLARSNVLNTFESFINFANEFNTYIKKGAPLIFALTKVDEVNQGDGQKNLPAYCISDSYPRNYRTELSIIRNKGLEAFIDTLAKKNYIFALSCAPYGFSPLPLDDPMRDSFPMTEQQSKWREDYINDNPQVPLEAIPHPVYRPVDPRNVGMIMDWLEKLFGIKPIVYDEENEKMEIRDISATGIHEGHFDDVLVSMIACMFCNPNEIDFKWYRTLGDFSLLKKLKQTLISRKAVKLSQGEKDGTNQ